MNRTHASNAGGISRESRTECQYTEPYDSSGRWPPARGPDQKSADVKSIMAADRAGYVLVGGRSSRFGSDKAIFPWQGRPLALRVAEQVLRAAGSVALVGNPEIYKHLGLPVIPDPVSGAGPLAGLAAALGHSPAEWNLGIATSSCPSIRPGVPSRSAQSTRSAASRRFRRPCSAAYARSPAPSGVSGYTRPPTPIARRTMPAGCCLRM